MCVCVVLLFFSQEISFYCFSDWAFWPNLQLLRGLREPRGEFGHHDESARIFANFRERSIEIESQTCWCRRFENDIERRIWFFLTFIWTQTAWKVGEGIATHRDHATSFIWTAASHSCVFETQNKKLSWLQRSIRRRSKKRRKTFLQNALLLHLLIGLITLLLKFAFKDKIDHKYIRTGRSANSSFWEAETQALELDWVWNLSSSAIAIYLFWLCSYMHNIFSIFHSCSFSNVRTSTHAHLLNHKIEHMYF